MLFELLSLLGVWIKHFLFAGYISGGVFPKPLTPKEEEKYVAEMHSGSMQAREILIERNLRLVAHVVKKYAGTANQDTEDLISIGTIGLIKAVDSFNGDKKIRLATYAARCIHNEILMHFRALKKRQTELSLDDPVGTDGEGNTLSLMQIVHEEADDIEDDIVLKGKIEMLYTLMDACLTEREREILILRFGLGGNDALAQREIASKMHISRSYVSRIEKKAISKLKENMKACGYGEEDEI